MQLSVTVNNKYTPLAHFVYVLFSLPFCAFCCHGPRGLTCVNLEQSSSAEHILFSNYLPTALCPPHHDQFTNSVFKQYISTADTSLSTVFLILGAAVGCVHFLTCISVKPQTVAASVPLT